METRSFALNLNTDDLHKNRELPGAFTCHLGVLDTTLPVKGTAHRRVRGTTMDEDATVNVFFDTQLTFLLLPTKKPAIHCKLLLSKKNKYIHIISITNTKIILQGFVEALCGAASLYPCQSFPKPWLRKTLSSQGLVMNPYFVGKHAEI